VLVKKVPGSIHFMEHADFFSFGLTGIDLTHTIHWFYFGARPSPQGYHQLQRLHPMGLNPDWLDKLKGRTFSSDSLEHTHEHYLKVRRGFEICDGHLGLDFGWVREQQLSFVVARQTVLIYSWPDRLHDWSACRQASQAVAPKMASWSL
jgi:hypothetical protein